MKAYALGESFLRRLDHFPDHLQGWKFDHGRVKEPFEPPLFSLLNEEEYRVTIAILNKVNNPYLHFVTSPEEILLAGPLFRLNPSLDPERLARSHFETLLRDELAKSESRW